MAEEFKDLDLGDVRLNKRAIKLADRLFSKPTGSIPMSCGNWGETQAAYRFIGNESVHWRGIMRPHQEQTQKRMGEEEVVLCLEDTTELDFSSQEIEGMGRLNYERRRGMYVHPTYAVTINREPLGVLGVHMWAREGKGVKKSEKESARWIKGYEGVANVAKQLPNTRLVYVADRESDMVELMNRAQELGTPADWLIRAQQNRCLPQGSKLWDEATAGEPLGGIQFNLSKRVGHPSRQVRQHIWAQRVELPTKGKNTVTATCIVAQEIDVPEGEKPVVWRLLTNREANTLKDVIELIDWYRARWEIEIFFHVLKNGCQVEALQLSSIDRVERALALFMVVSWRIARLMRCARQYPDMDASLLFDSVEIRSIYLLTKKKLPEKPPLREVLRLVAQLGGFLGRKSDGEPGVKTIWRGLLQVMLAAETLRMAQREI